MFELQKYILGELKKIHPRVYLEEGPQRDDIYPFVVYQFPTTNEEEWREDYILEIDVWDHPESGSTVELQRLADSIDRALNRTRFISSDRSWSTRIYRVNRLMIPDPDPEIKRRQLRYELKTYAI